MHSKWFIWISIQEFPDGNYSFAIRELFFISSRLVRQIPTPHVEDRKDQIKRISKHKSDRDRRYNDIGQNTDTVDSAYDQDGFFGTVHNAHDSGCELDDGQD